MPVAARQTDPIQHSNALTGLLVGAAVGLAVGAFVVCTGGVGGIVAAAVVGGAVAGGAGLGEVAGSLSISGGTVTGSIASGSGNTAVNSLPAARAYGDAVLCAGTPPLYLHGHDGSLVAQGSATVLVNSLPASRIGDKLECGSEIQAGSSNVIIGGPTVTVVQIQNEVPGEIHTALFVIGLASGIVLTGPVVAIGGLIGGTVGGYGGSWLGGQLFGEGSDGQKLFALGGGFLGGLLGAKGAQRPAAYLGESIGGPWGEFVRAGVPAFNAYTPEGAAARYIKEGIPNNDYTLPDGQDPAFWTGKGALDAAQEAGFGTMENTQGGQRTIRFVDGIKDTSSWDTQRPVWVESSRAYGTEVASQYGTFDPNTGLPITGPNAGRPVTVFVSDQANPQSIYFTTEKPLLQSYGVNIVEVIVPTSP